LIFIGAFRFTTKTKINCHRPLDTCELQTREPELNVAKNQLRIQTSRIRTFFEDAFDEIELLSFPVSRTPFDLLQTKYRGNKIKDLLHHHKKTVKC
jgi:hypothetical protein